jgi:predicted acylesterase/phospholipase RssA
MIRNLVISGGSTKSISVLGCLKFLDEMGVLEHITTFVGTSAGSIIALLLALGFTTNEMIAFLKDNMFGQKLYQLQLDEVINFSMVTSFGLDSGNNIIQFIEDAVMLKYHTKDMTFLELAKCSGKHLVVCVANITKEVSEFFSVDTHPNASVVQAVRMSISLPLIFTPIKYKDCYYVDGAIYESFPI